MFKQILGIVMAVALGIVVAWYGVKLRPSPEAPAQQASNLPAGGDFTLQSVKGPVSLHDLKGKVVVLYFGYTACPDICPTSMGTLKAALGQLTPQELQQVQGIFVSVDPERDTLEHVQTYAGYFHPNIMGLSGKLDALNVLAKQYGAFFRKVEMPGSAMAYTIDHTATLYVLDKDGKVRETVQHAAPPAELAAAIRKYL
jgi:protein SCO1/2